MATKQSTRKSTDASVKGPGLPWWQRGKTWAWGVLVLGVSAGLSDLVKQLVSGAASMIGELLDWLLESQPMPRLLILMAFGVVGLAAAAGVMRRWPKPKAAKAPADPPNALRSFRGGIYHGRPWSWTTFDRDGIPIIPDPHCELDGARLRVDFFPGSKSPRWTCPDCKRVIDRERLREPDDIALLAGRDITTNRWPDQQRTFEQTIIDLAEKAHAKEKA